MFASWDGVVFDLDGTLVELDVDWDGVATAVEAALAEQGIETEASDTWGFLDVAREADVLDHIEAIVAEHERVGAERSEALPLSRHLDDVTGPIGVCSLNCEEACRIALERHELADHVETIIGRDSVPGWKPDPGPLAAAIDGLEIAQDGAVFVGDSKRDAVTARRLGVDFRYVRATLSELDG